MNTATVTASGSRLASWLGRAEAWLDDRGRWAWIAAMVAGFLVFPPLGLAFLAYMIWGKRMFGSCKKSRRHTGLDRHQESARESARAWAREWASPDRTAFRPSGNATFDAYKADTLRRLEDEQEAFEGFLQRLRDARDKQEFDRFMEDRARETTAEVTEAVTPTTAEPRRGEY